MKSEKDIMFEYINKEEWLAVLQFIKFFRKDALSNAIRENAKF